MSKGYTFFMNPRTYMAHVTFPSLDAFYALAHLDRPVGSAHTRCKPCPFNAGAGAAGPCVPNNKKGP